MQGEPRLDSSTRAKVSVMQPERHGLEPDPLKVVIIGGGNFATSVAKIIAENASKHDIFDSRVAMWVYEEVVEGEKLTDIINTRHENPKYLPGIALPSNLWACPNLEEAARGASLLVFVIPHQFAMNVVREMAAMKSHAEHAIAISLIKGIEERNNVPKLYSQLISEALELDCSVLSGANVAKGGISESEFTETTIGYRDPEHARIWQLLFDRPSFKVTCMPDVAGVEVCGALKNVVALGVGFSNSQNCGPNTAAAVIRLGFAELRLFATLFFTNICQETFFESAGIADVITTCFGGRNLQCAQIFGEHDGKKTWDEIEENHLKGQKLQGPHTCIMVHNILEGNNMTRRFPLFELIYKITTYELPPSQFNSRLQTAELIPIKRPSDCAYAAVPRSLRTLKTKLLSWASTAPDWKLGVNLDNADLP